MDRKCEIKAKDHLYRIGLFAQMNHVSVKALRFYEEQGLLIPRSIDEETGYRYYTLSQMEKLHRILALKEVGFTLEDIKKLNLTNDEEAFLINKKNEILNKIANLTLQLSKIEGYLHKGSSSLAYPIMIKKIPKVLCATLKRRIDGYEDLFTLMPEAGKLMEEAKCECAIPEYCFTNYLEDEYKEEKILVEVCESIVKKTQEVGDLKFKEFPEVEVASIYHKGPYSSLPKAYEAILRFIDENGYEIDGNIRENYIDGIWNKDSEEDWLTEIQIPVKVKRNC